MSAWYYEQDGAQMGPVSHEELQSMVEGGRLHGDSLVWNENMDNWQSLSTALPDLAALAPAGAVASDNPYQAPQAQSGAEGAPYTPHPVERSANTAMGLGIGAIVGALCCALIGVILGIIAIVKANEVAKAIDAEPSLAGQPFLQKAQSNANIGKITGIIGIVLGILNGALGIFIQLGGLMG